MQNATSKNSTTLAFDQRGERHMTHALTRQTRALLICGLIAGPFYIVVGLIQALTRPGSTSCVMTSACLQMEIWDGFRSPTWC